MLNGGKPEQIFAERLAETIRDAHDVLDVGTSQRFAKELRRYEQWFAGKRYVAAGYEPSQTYGAYNCDCHQDIQAMSFADESFDAVLCIEVVEHVADPFAATRELRRVLRPGGRLLLTTPFLSQYHGKANAIAAMATLVFEVGANSGLTRYLPEAAKQTRARHILSTDAAQLWLFVLIATIVATSLTKLLAQYALIAKSSTESRCESLAGELRTAASV